MMSISRTAMVQKCVKVTALSMLYTTNPARSSGLDETARNGEKQDEKTLRKDPRKGVQLSAKLKEHRQAFLDMPTESQSMWDGQLGRIRAAKHNIDSLNEDVRLVHSAPY